jgi:L-alanine-DL-glutamate epimerase-like enolase superfamily enzyme
MRGGNASPAERPGHGIDYDRAALDAKRVE